MDSNDMWALLSNLYYRNNKYVVLLGHTSTEEKYKIIECYN